MSEARRARAARQERTFRLLLVLGAAASVAVGFWGVLWTDMLERVVGLQAPVAVSGYDALGRMFGAVMLTLGLGYALAAAQPHRARSLLVVLLAAPLALGAVVIAGAARGEISGGRGAGYAAFNVVYCLLYIRFYPRVEEPPSTEEAAGELSPEPPVT